MCDSRESSLVDLLHEIMRHCYYHDGDEKKIALIEKWRIFYDAWTEDRSEAKDNG